MLTNLIAGVQIAVTQPIRIDDAVIVENEWGWIEEITRTYVVRAAVGLAAHDRAADLFHREAVPELDAGDGLADRLGVLYVDYSVPGERGAGKPGGDRSASPLWDGRGGRNCRSPRRSRLRRIARPGERAHVAADLGPGAARYAQVVGFRQREHPDALPTARVRYTADARRDCATRTAQDFSADYLTTRAMITRISWKGARNRQLAQSGMA